MAAIADRWRDPSIRPFHALLLGGALALFLGALLNDIAYAYTHEIQWSNFASWLIVGGLLVSGAAIVCALIGLAPSRRARYSVLHALVLLASWIVAFFNALIHARDAWGVMPEGLVLSAVVFVLTCVATCVGYCVSRVGGGR